MAQEEKAHQHEHPTKHLNEFHLGERILSRNDACCDCDAPKPTWALITHGVLICDECAKIHETLKTSKLHLIGDSHWSNQMVKDFYHCGNHKGCNNDFNKIWEYYVNSKETSNYKPTMYSDSNIRGKYITLKYYQKLFHKSNHNDKNEASYPLSMAISNNNNNNNVKDSSSNDKRDKSGSDEKSDNNNNNNNNNKNSNKFCQNVAKNDMMSDVQPNGTLKLYFMNAESLPVADKIGGIFDGKADPYVYVYQRNAKQMLNELIQSQNRIRNDKDSSNVFDIIKNENIDEYNDSYVSQPPTDDEKEKYCTHVIENELNPCWMTNKDKEKNSKNVKCIKLNVIEKLPVYIEVWDYDKMTQDDLLAYYCMDVLTDCYPFYQEHELTKELTLMKIYQKQKKYTKHGQIPTIRFYATYNKLF